MTTKFLTSSSQGVNVTDGSVNIFGNTLSAQNFVAGTALRTNGVRQIVSSDLNISDVTGLQAELDSALENPMTEALDSADFEIQKTGGVEYKKVASTSNANAGYIKLYSGTDNILRSIDEAGVIDIFHTPWVRTSTDLHPAEDGDTINGSSLSGGDLTLQSTTHATKGLIKINDPIDISGNTTAPSIHSEGQMYWDTNDKTLNIQSDIDGVTLNVGSEFFIRVRNNTGSTITNGSIVYVTGSISSNPTVALADASDTNKVGVLGMATHDIGNNTVGIVTTLGLVHDLDTSSFVEGDLLYLSDTTPGGITTTSPLPPSFAIKIGLVTNSHVSMGIIKVAPGIKVNNTVTVNQLGTILGFIDQFVTSPITLGESGQTGLDTNFVNTSLVGGLNELKIAQGTIEKITNGVFLTDIDSTVTSDGAVVTFTLDRLPTGTFAVKIDGVILTSTSINIVLAAGSDTAPQAYFIWVYNNGGVVTLDTSTSAWPSIEHARISTVFVQSAASIQTFGVLKHHQHDNHLEYDDSAKPLGALPHISEWIRNQNATFVSGTGLTPTITTNGGSADNVDIQIASGTILQLHPQTMPVINTGTGDSVYVFNDNTVPYRRIEDLNVILTDSEGGSMSGKRFSLVVWGSINQNSADCKLFINVPSGSYNSNQNAEDDVDNHANYNFPTEFKGAGFLIARLVLRHQVAASGTWTLIANLNLLGKTPNISVGSSGSIVSTFSDEAFHLHDNADETKLLKFECSGITTGTTRTLIIPDADGTIALTGGSTDHGSLTGLGDDDHSQYALLTGRASDVLAIDVINEQTLNGGVTIDGLILKDNQLRCEDVFLDDELKVDRINENSSAVGVTIDSVLLKDNAITLSKAVGGILLNIINSTNASVADTGIEFLHSTSTPGDLSTAKIFTTDHLNLHAIDHIIYNANTSAGSFAHLFQDNGTARFTIASTGILTSLASYSSDVNGLTNRDLLVSSTGIIGYDSGSLTALKMNISDIVDASWIYELKPKTYNFRKKEDNNLPVCQLRHGFLAEDVQIVKDDICVFDDEENKQQLIGVRLKELIAPMILLIQQQKTLIDTLQSDHNILLANFNTLLTSFNVLEGRVNGYHP